MLRDPRFAKILLATGAGLRDNKTMEVLEEAVRKASFLGHRQRRCRLTDRVAAATDERLLRILQEFGEAKLPGKYAVSGDLTEEVGFEFPSADFFQELEVSEISRRFRRYKDPALALAMDAADDAKIEKEVDIDIDNFEDLRKNIRSEEL
ncbi:hypothetical protein AK812_SmicGene31045 [Symbiodinium microadriaticum]|uniref:Uncharacterized protein n=1 Tax=Symbiodinium microadriaticum TaxID=2951 RepID=A0A1Q9CXQ4_SYMMI|nr:hypothetical protein AK812_SmicGene31045 [Symbiodinium microadriaticum]